MSHDGRYVVFDSTASNLVSGDTKGVSDVFLLDMQTGTTQLISDTGSGTLGNDGSFNPSISSDGKFVVFESLASNFVSPAPASYGFNIYVKDLSAGELTLVSKNANGDIGDGSSESPGISCDGGVITFHSAATNLSGTDTNGSTDVFVDVRADGDTLTNITGSGDNGGFSARVSCDGMHVAFTSSSTNLVSGNTNGSRDVFTFDRRSSTIARVSVDSSGNQGNADSSDVTISADGRLVGYDSAATDLVSGDTNGVEDVFMRDTITGSTYRVSVDASGQQGNAGSYAFYGSGFSGDGKYLYFGSSATNLAANDTGNVGGGFVAETGL